MSFRAGTSGPASPAPYREQVLQTFETGHWFAHSSYGGKPALINRVPASKWLRKGCQTPTVWGCQTLTVWRGEF
jgi:hypothetical protein